MKNTKGVALWVLGTDAVLGYLKRPEFTRVRRKVYEGLRRSVWPSQPPPGQEAASFAVIDS